MSGMKVLFLHCRDCQLNDDLKSERMAARLTPGKLTLLCESHRHEGEPKVITYFEVDSFEILGQGCTDARHTSGS